VAARRSIFILVVDSKNHETFESFLNNLLCDYPCLSVENAKNWDWWGKIGFMKNSKTRLYAIFFLSIMMLFGFEACDPSLPLETGAPEVTLTTTPFERVTEIVPTSTPIQTETTIVLLSSPDADAFALSQVQKSLEVLADESGFVLFTEEGLSIELMSNVPVVVAVGESIDINNLANRYPEVSFVAVDNNSAAPSVNLNVIGDPIVDQQRRSFMAGYLAALLSDDYKVAALAPVEGSSTETVLESFVVGVRFFCGICQPKYPPFQSFPQWETIPLGSSADTYQPILENYKNIGVEVIYAHGDLVSSEILTAITDLDIMMVGDQRPLTTSNNYVGTVLSDPRPALENLWQDLMNGNDGFQTPASIALVDRNFNLLSEGRYQLFMEMADNLQVGLVSPEAVP